MPLKRRIIVYILATIALVVLFLLPLMSFFAVGAHAVDTDQTAVSSGDYVFYIVENNDVPLAAAPTADVSVYMFWITLACLTITILFVYSAWYLSIRKNIGELSGRLTLTERRTYDAQQQYGFFHPVRSYRLEREVEDIVVSRYSRYI